MEKQYLIKAFGFVDDYGFISLPTKMSYLNIQRLADNIGCDRCSPHRGCNRSNKFSGQKSWKHYRKTQYKSVSF